MRVNEKIEKITEDTLIVGIDVGKTNCCMRFCDYRGREVYKKVWFDRTKDLKFLGAYITAGMHETGLTKVIVAFEPTGHYWLNINKYLNDNGIETVLMPTQTVKQEKGVHDQEMVATFPAFTSFYNQVQGRKQECSRQEAGVIKADPFL